MAGLFAKQRAAYAAEIGGVGDVPIATSQASLLANGQESFEIGKVRISPRELSLASSAGANSVEPKVMALLVALAEASGRVLLRGELIDRIWGLEYGCDESLTRAAYLLRRALKHPHGVEGAIRTISKSGYQLTVPVTLAANEDRRNGIHTQVEKGPILVVLPFDDLSLDGSMQVFSDGVSEEIIGRIARGSDLRVIGRTSSFQFRGARKSNAADELGASHVLDGAIRRLNDRVRINVQLVDALSDTIIWSQRFDELIEDILAVQDRIAEQVASALDLAFATPPAATIDPEAYDLYLQAKSKMLEFRSGGEAIPLLERATAAAPTYAPAWALLANVRALTATFAPISERKAMIARSRTEIARCLAADPGSVDILSAEYYVLDPIGEYSIQQEIIDRARVVGINIPDLQFLIARHYTNIGMVRKATSHADAARQLNPFDIYKSAIYGMCLYYLGDLKGASRILHLDFRRHPNNYFTTATLLVCAALMGDWDTVDFISSPARLQLYPLYEYSPLLDVVRVERDPTPLARAQLVEPIVERALSSGTIDIIWLIVVAKYGTIETAFRVAEICRLGPKGGAGDELGPGAYRTNHLFVRHFDEMRRDRRFATVCARFGLAQHWLETGMWPDCAVEENLGYDFKAECAHAAKTVPAESFYL